MDLTRESFACFCVLLAFSARILCDRDPAPHILTDMNDVLNGVFYGALIRVEVNNVSKCVVKFPNELAPHDLYIEIDTAETHVIAGRELIVAAFEREVNGTKYRSLGPVIRQTRTSIRADGTVLIEVMDLGPISFTYIVRGSLYCAWRNQTNSKLEMGVFIWQEQEQATEMGSVVTLNEAASQGHMMTYFINAEMLKPPQPLLRWSGFVRGEFTIYHYRLN
ncbi:uncharacterized protein LOC101850722 [Aplysia californica]|uniref:Uncharacterized protein LOC101850722 n=1 Tax=Aplysia californica TaxID=6500 RepID=A0ABM0JRC6_APLCA|nr:uncharacterized protein LOC101850722 [Aplysia californica]